MLLEIFRPLKERKRIFLVSLRRVISPLIYKPSTGGYNTFYARNFITVKESIAFLTRKKPMPPRRVAQLSRRLTTTPHIRRLAHRVACFSNCPKNVERQVGPQSIIIECALDVHVRAPISYRYPNCFRGRSNSLIRFELAAA